MAKIVLTGDLFDLTLAEHCSINQKLALNHVASLPGGEGGDYDDEAKTQLQTCPA
jgi:hypothetical protein